jgi:hypothetical protein
MSNQLLFDFQLKPCPYSQSEKSISDRWGAISIWLQTNGEKILLLQTEWEIFPLAEWFTKNYVALRDETLTVPGNSLPALSSESLAQTLNRLQDSDLEDQQEEEEEAWFDQLFAFRQAHALRFALRGARIPDIVIGNSHGTGEISLSNENEEWRYTFDMNQFLEDLSQKLESIKDLINPSQTLDSVS